MSTEKFMRNVEILLEQMIEEPEAVLEALDPSAQQQFITTLGQLADRATHVDTDADLINLSYDIYALVEGIPELRDLLLPSAVHTETVHKQRKVTLADHQATSVQNQYTQAYAPQVINSVLECRQKLEQRLCASIKAEGTRDGQD